MRIFEFKKIPGSAFNSTMSTFLIIAKHQEAKHEESIAEVYDLQIVEAITDFLNKREKEFETARLNRLMNVENKFESL